MCATMVKVYIEFFMKTTVVSYLLSSNRKFIKYKKFYNKKYIQNVKQQQPNNRSEQFFFLLFYLQRSSELKELEKTYLKVREKNNKIDGKYI